MVEAITLLSIPQFWPPDSLDYRSELIIFDMYVKVVTNQPIPNVSVKHDDGVEPTKYFIESLRCGKIHTCIQI